MQQAGGLLGWAAPWVAASQHSVQTIPFNGQLRCTQPAAICQPRHVQAAPHRVRTSECSLQEWAAGHCEAHWSDDRHCHARPGLSGTAGHWEAVQVLRFAWGLSAPRVAADQGCRRRAAAVCAALCNARHGSWRLSCRNKARCWPCTVALFPTWVPTQAALVLLVWLLQEEAWDIADQVVIFNKGAIEQQGTPQVGSSATLLLLLLLLCACVL